MTTLFLQVPPSITAVRDNRIDNVYSQCRFPTAAFRCLPMPHAHTGRRVLLNRFARVREGTVTVAQVVFVLIVELLL